VSFCCTSNKGITVNVTYAFTVVAYDAQKRHYIMLHKAPLSCLSLRFYTFVTNHFLRTRAQKLVDRE